MSERDFSNDPFTLLFAATPTDEMSEDECNALAKFQEIAKKIETEREKINSLNSFLHSSQSQNVPQTIKDFSQSQIKASTELISDLSNQVRELERSPILNQLVYRLSLKAHEEQLRQTRIKMEEAAQEERKKIIEEYNRKREIAVASYKNTLNRKEQNSKADPSGGYLNAAKSASYSDDNFSVISHNVDAPAPSERNETVKTKLSIASIVSLFISTFALVLFGMLLDGRSIFPPLGIYWAWIILSVVSIVFPVYAKYYRNKHGAKGKALEILSLILGAFDFHCVIIYAVKLNDYIALALIAVVCVIYAKSFNNCRKEQCDQVKPAAKSLNVLKSISYKGGNFGFIAHNMAAIYLKIDDSLFGRRLNLEQKLFATALIDMQLYIANGVLSIEDIAQAVSYAVEKTICLPPLVQKLEDLDYCYNSYLLSLTMQVEAMIFCVDTNETKSQIINSVIENCSSIAEAINKTFDDAKRGKIDKTISDNTSFTLFNHDFQQIVLSYDERTRNIDANPASTPRTTAVPAAESKKEDKKHSFVLPFILVVLAVSTAISIVQYENEKPEVQIPEQTTQPVLELVAKTPPAHGQLLKYPENNAVAPLEIQTSGTGYYYFVLTVLGNKDKPIMSFFAHAEKSVEVEVPFGKYDLYYAYGNTWYGTEDLFGDNTIRKKCEDPLFFGYDGESYTGWTLTLYPVKDGNLDTVYVSEDEFP